MYGGGAAAVQPRAWRNFVEHLLPEERDNVLQSYYARLQSQDAAVRDAAVRNCLALSPLCALLFPSTKCVNRVTDWTPAMSRECQIIEDPSEESGCLALVLLTPPHAACTAREACTDGTNASSA